MVKSATNGNVAADMRPTDYRGAVKRLETIDNKTTKQQKIAKEIGDVYSAVEGICGVNKLAARMWRSLRKLEPAERLEVFRDVNGLIDAAGWDREDADLVDKAQDNVVHLRMGDDAEDDEEPGDDLNDDEKPVDDDFEASEAELAQQEGRDRLAKARGRAKKAAEPPAEETPPPADDSDLADAGAE